MNILVTGSKGQLGSYIVDALKGRKINFVSANRSNFDLTNHEMMTNLLNKEKPTHIINCAAYTDVKGAEANVELCNKVNSEAVYLMSKWSNENDSTMIQISTDYVFSGSDGEYKEEAKCAPINTYGETKMIAEECVLKNKRHFIIRVSWVYSKRISNFIPFIYKELSSGNDVHAADDQFGSPTYAPELALFIINNLLDSKEYGIYNYHDNDYGSRLYFANKIAKHLKASKDNIKSVSISKFEKGVCYPRDLKLPLGKIMKIFKVTPNTFDDNFVKYMEDK